MLEQHLKHGRQLLESELAAIQTLCNRLDNNFAQACELILQMHGTIIVTGLGKSGHIARKIAATFASTGTPAYFLHAAEALHGDLGLLSKNDLVLACSHSGQTEELLQLLPAMKRMGVPLIAITSAPDSALAKAAQLCLALHVQQEACPLGLAPTSSTITMLALGDALAVSVLQARGFSAEDFARFHPAGSLGRRLLLTVADVMITGHAIPTINLEASLFEGIVEISQKGLGMVMILDENQQLVGIFTDGDLRRTLERKVEIYHTSMRQLMNHQFTTIHADVLATQALYLMQQKRINALPVVDAKQNIVGALNIHTLWRAGVF
jgi:arabinose-5-phosphate isomerase